MVEYEYILLLTVLNGEPMERNIEERQENTKGIERAEKNGIDDAETDV